MTRTNYSSEIAGQQYVANGAAGRAAFGNIDFRRGPVNVDVITLNVPPIRSSTAPSDAINKLRLSSNENARKFCIMRSITILVRI